MPDVKPELPEQELPLWAQVTLAAWALGCVVVFVRQILVALG